MILLAVGKREKNTCRQTKPNNPLVLVYTCMYIDMCVCIYETMCFFLNAVRFECFFLRRSSPTTCGVSLSLSRCPSSTLTSIYEEKNSSTSSQRNSDFIRSITWLFRICKQVFVLHATNEPTPLWTKDEMMTKNSPLECLVLGRSTFAVRKECEGNYQSILKCNTCSSLLRRVKGQEKQMLLSDRLWAALECGPLLLEKTRFLQSSQSL